MNYSLWRNINYVYRKVFHFNRKLKILIPIFILSSITIPVLLSIIPAIAIGLITSDAQILFFIMVMGIVSFGFAGLSFLNQYLQTYITFENIFVRMKEFIFIQNHKLMTTDYVNVEPQEKQLMIQKSLDSLSSNWIGPEFMMKNTPPLIINIFGLVLYSVLISSLNYLIIIVLVLMALLNYLLTMYARNYEQKNKDKWVRYDRQFQYLYESSTSLVNGKDVRIYRMEKWFYTVFKGLIKKRIRWSKRVEYRYFLPSISDNVLLFARDLIAYGMLISMVLNNTIDVTMFTFFVGIIGGFSLWLNNAVTAYSNLKRANLGVNDFRAFEEQENQFNHHQGCSMPTEFPLTIEFKDVSFRYPGASKDTITDLNLNIEGGSKVALVGLNGAGKTTLVKLLSGLYYPTKGKIFVDGKSITEYNIEEYHRLIGAVYQDVEVLAFTIAKNVACSNQYNLERVDRCLELAGLKAKVDSLKDKENTHLTQSLDKNGIMLSGGEMQKLMLARALYKDAPIMILDEPTAALDPIAESELYEKYNDLTQDKTSLFISHRLSSTKFCDRILFLEDGRIVEDGSHQELMIKQGQYAKIYDIQSHYYKENLEETNEN